MHPPNVLVLNIFLDVKIFVMSESENENNSDIEVACSIGCCSVIPEKSKERYEKMYNCFKKWFKENYGNSINEKFLLEYFVQSNPKLISHGSL